MDQTNNVARSLVQTMVSQAALSGTGKAGSGDEGFHRLLEKVKISRETLPGKRPPDAEISPVRPKLEKASAPKQTDTVEQAKKLAEQGYALTQPVVGNIQMDLAMEEVIGEFAAGEYALAQVDGDGQMLPMADLASLEQAQPQQLLDEIPVQTMDVSDPEADAILEATAPGADNSPAALLEKLVDEEIGHVAQQAVESTQPQQEEEDDGIQAELTDVEQAPQHIFHDVESVPVKVGEAESAEQTNEADVVRQVENQIGQVIQSGESTVTVRLNPENLGEVTVEVSMKSDGIVNVAISARNDDTRALLERHSAHLQELVSSRTQQSVEVNVQRQQESQQNQNRQHSYDGHNGHAQDGQQERRQRRGNPSSQDFIQQLRLGLIPTDGES